MIFMEDCGIGLRNTHTKIVETTCFVLILKGIYSIIRFLVIAPNDSLNWSTVSPPPPSVIKVISWPTHPPPSVIKSDHLASNSRCQIPTMFLKLLFSLVMFLVAPNSMITHLACSGVNGESAHPGLESGDSEIEYSRVTSSL